MTYTKPEITTWIAPAIVAVIDLDAELGVPSFSISAPA
jgi:hypothetical protein